ncbi:MAG: hypothetical protein AB1782_11365 [Cyanobacteriota bacterium]
MTNINKHKIIYEINFNNLEIMLPVNYCREEEKVLHTFKRKINNVDVSFTYLNPALIDYNDILSFIYQTTEGPWRLEFPRFFDKNKSITTNDLNNKNNATIVISKKWKQLIQVEFEVEITKNSDFLFELTKTVFDDIHNWLKILRHKFSYSRWLLPEFIISESENGKYEIRNNNIINTDCDIKIKQFINDAETYKELCIDLNKSNYLEIKQELYNVSDIFKQSISKFQNITNNNQKYEIETVDELIIQAELQKGLKNIKEQMLLSAMAVEISIASIIKNYGNELHKFLLGKRIIKSSDRLKYIIGDIKKNNKSVLENIEMDKLKKLFDIRNKIAHEGKAYYKQHNIDSKEANDYFKFVKDFVTEKVPKIIQEIENNN